MSNKLLVVIAGPTGVGKTEMAVQLARQFHTEVISADSRQVYQEMDIGVGRPSRALLSNVRHHLIGHTSIHQRYTAAMFAREANAILQTLFGEHDIVILAGGTGLYIKALTEGLDDIPEVPTEIFQKWQMLWQKEGNDPLLASLKELDPDYYARVDQSNYTRLIRALSVIETTGSTFSSFLKGEPIRPSYKVLNIVLELPREELYERIDQRVLEMIDKGWLEEAKALYPYKQLQALQTVGYKELFDYLDNTLSLEEAIAAIQQSTRRYAKRQLTWWRNQGNWKNFHPTDGPAIIKYVQEIFDAAQPEIGE